MIYVLYTIHIVTCLFLIIVVLLQQGKGADLSAFAGGSTQAAFGARGAATLLHKMTVGFFVLFIVTTLTIGMLQIYQRQSTVMSGAVDEETATEPSTQPDDVPAGAPTPEEGTVAPPPANTGAENASSSPSTEPPGSSP